MDDPSSEGMFDFWIVIVQYAVLGLTIIGLLYAILFATAALGLTSFSVLERFRKRRRKDPEEGGIDDLF